MRKTLLLCATLTLGLTGLPSPAQTARNVDLAWTASTSTSVTGYNVFRGTTASGPFTQLNSAPITTLVYVDASAAVGQTYTYYVTAVAAACTPSTPASTPCGQSAPSANASTTVPPQPAVTVTVTVTVP